MTERELLERAKRGDYQAFLKLIEPHERRIYNLALRITGNREDAEDVLQETLLNVLENLQGFRGDAAFGTWIYRIALHNALRVVQQRKRLETVSLEQLVAEEKEDEGPLPRPELIAEWHDPEEVTERHELRRLLKEALQQLPETYRSVFVLRDMEGLSTKEVAQVLGISEANVKVRLLRARLKLREILTHYFGDMTKRLEPHDHERE